MTATELTEELEVSKRGLNRCKCGSPVVMTYVPGCTLIHCIKENVTKTALPDWQPTELKRQWNSQ